MFKILISTEARKDLKGIARYTLRTWGKPQMHKYARELMESIKMLEHNAAAQGYDCGDIACGLRRLPHEDHYYIFFRVKGESIEIIENSTSGQKLAPIFE